MRTMILALGAAWALATGAQAADAEFKDWWVACDNTPDCTAFGFVEDAGNENPAYLKLTRGAGRNDGPMISVVGQLDAKTWRLQVDGKAVAGVLYAPLCNMGAYNFVHVFVTADEQGRNPKILDIRYANGSASDGMLMNADYDPESRILNNFEKGRGLGDCGAGNAWAWTGKDFVQIDQALMSVCKGVSSEDWPTVFRSGHE